MIDMSLFTASEKLEIVERGLASLNGEIADVSNEPDELAHALKRDVDADQAEEIAVSFTRVCDEWDELMALVSELPRKA